MRIQQVSSYDALSEKAAFLVAAQVALKPDSVLGMATGSTPVGLYEQLIRMNQAGVISFARVRTFNLDEYRNLPASHPESYRSFMFAKLFDHIDIPRDNIHLPDGNCADVERECRAYEAAIERVGGIDLQILGIGHDGHIGFNEPGSSFSAETHEVTLTETTRKANARFFGGCVENVPDKAITLGVRFIMQAKHLLLLCNGLDKSEILKAALHGPIRPEVPASVLQLHANVDVIFCN